VFNSFEMSLLAFVLLSEFAVLLAKRFNTSVVCTAGILCRPWIQV